MSYTITDIYKQHIAEEGFIDKSLFKDICESFNIEIMNNLLSGGTFNMKNKLATLSVARRSRDPRSPKIDWGESMKYKKELQDEGTELYDSLTGKGQKWYVYFTDGYYCKYFWNKGKCRIPNKSAYRFTPTRGLKGNKEKLVNLLKSDDLAYLKFKKHGSI